MAHEFFNANFNKKILLNFLVKIGIKKLMWQFVYFQDEIAHLFFLQNEALRSESVNKFKNYYSLNINFYKIN